ncbi:MAG: hypothetical protein ACOZNI_33150 [Myxococcota bacterium]
MQKPLSIAVLAVASVVAVATSPAYDYTEYEAAEGEPTLVEAGGELVYTARIGVTPDVAAAAAPGVGVRWADGEEGPLQVEAVLPSGEVVRDTLTVREARDLSGGFSVGLWELFADCAEPEADGLCWREVDVFVLSTGADARELTAFAYVDAYGTWPEGVEEGDARVAVEILPFEQ